MSGRISVVGSWFKSWFIKNLWHYPDRLSAAKITMAMALLTIPLLIVNQPFFAVTLALGSLAGALSETDDHPRGRIKTLLLTILSFLISSTSVELLRPFPVVFGGGLVLSTILFIIIGGLGERYRGITFGAVLIGIYTMLGSSISPAWYLQPILLASGALFYGLISTVLLFFRPYRLLEEQLSRGYFALADYLKEKADLFPSFKNDQAVIRNRLSLLNVKVVVALEKCKEVLNSYSDEVKNQEVLLPYLERFMLLQSLHERAASSHDKYENFTDNKHNEQITKGLGELLLQLSLSVKKAAVSLLTGVPYKHQVANRLIINALFEKLKESGNEMQHSFYLLLLNLSRSDEALQNLNSTQPLNIIPRLKRDERTLFERFKQLLKPTNQRFRYAIRLSMAFLIGYLILLYFKPEKGEWILLTSLFVSQPSYSETRKRFVQRVGGTISGVVGGILIIQLIPTPAGQLILLLASAYAFFIWLKNNYAVAVIFITVFVLCVFNLVASQGVEMMLPRFIDTVIGAAISIIVIRLLWPDWQYKRLPFLLTEALLSNSLYFKAVFDDTLLSNDDYEYRVARRRAHLADNELAVSWRGMRMEPKKRQHLMQNAYTITYLNHALLSYISALGAHKNSNILRSSEVLKYQKEILKVLDNTVMHFSGENEAETLVDLSPLLLELSEQINNCDDLATRQQFKLLYNITDVSNRLFSEARAIDLKRKVSK
ncbi:MAG: FUSC family protein [Bacteroidales bacterium]|nr:FUSC family protein [Bacteroidales bacterium]MBN2819295.1 FUSC family protein [Bacteroidales bacterium]